MTITITSPCDTVEQVSGKLPNEGSVLAVLAKRTYIIDQRGRCIPADVQLPLQQQVVFGDEGQDLVAADTDLVHFKPLTDVVVLGQVHVQQPQAEIGIAVQIGGVSKLVKVLGARRAAFNAGGRVVFSRPEPFTSVPLSFALAYGGRDSHAEAKYGIPAAEFAQFLPPGFDVTRLSPYRYPRNPCGRGYLIEATKDAIEAVDLPQLEDPEDRLTPERIAAGHPLRWTDMPVSQSLGWLGHSWFPRSSFFGVLPEHEPPTRQLFEIRKGWIPADSLVSGPVQARFSMRAANGASLGLQVPYLRGDEDCALYNLSPSEEVMKFKLPGECPGLWTDGRKGKLNETKPVIHSLIIEPDHRRLSIVWRGNAPALRPYMPDELASMPLKVKW